MLIIYFKVEFLKMKINVIFGNMHVIACTVLCILVTTFKALSQYTGINITHYVKKHMNLSGLEIVFTKSIPRLKIL